MSFITGVGLTPFGRHEGASSLDLMSKAAQAALDDAGLKRSEIDGILCGYSTVSHVAYPHDWQVSQPPLRVRRPPHWGQPVPASGTPWVSTCPSRVPSR